MPQYETVIGLEVHVELKTRAKIFCDSTTEFGGAPNTHVCPVCLGLPGVLPVVNKKVVEYAIRAALALNCKIARFSKFDRKNYYYPDMPKNYQISQHDLPIAKHGYLKIDTENGAKKIGITRLHMEEDSGKLVHQGTITASPFSLVDYNRAGVPLIEVVSEPDLRSPEEARQYMEKLRAIILYTGISDCKMEEGSLRCDANISVRPVGTDGFGTKAEIKNLNSFKALQRSLNFEIERQIKTLEAGGRIIQETRTWDEGKGETLSLRSKEHAHDYRYLPDPDLVPLLIDRQWVEDICGSLPELPDHRRERYIKEYGLPDYDAAILTNTKELADYFEDCVKVCPNPKAVSNWIMGDFTRLLNLHGLEITECKITPQNLASLLGLIEQGTISGKIAKTVFAEMFAGGTDAETIVKEKGLVQISDKGAVIAIVEEVLVTNPGPVADFRAGRERALGFLVGRVMKATQGKANPELVNKLLREKL
ncbi:MAG: Asp-tRNA(Asn)/Glu-tRNA(Gln) amidotransferase subunit GatB [Desulfotomaculaceae bacterium]|nr:Asp-tRNA(Asn)/Glu-tRNA(Gln) amidotransferase subunit GatB [Desulfotomaculaceae bacterium]